MKNPSSKAAQQIRADAAYKADLFGPQHQLLASPTTGGSPSIPSMPVRKHTNLVHSKSPMTCLQRQVFNALLYHAHHELRDNSALIHEIPIQDLAALIGFESNNTQHLKQSLRNLVTCQLEFNVLDEKGAEIWEAMTALAGVQFRNGRCYYQFAEFLRPKLYHPERYGLLYLDDMRRLTMTASTALYENATRFAKWGVTPYFSIAQLRALLGAESKTYDDFRRLNNKVLNPAVKQINDVTSFDIAPEIEYERRKASKVRFKVRPKAKREVLLAESDEQQGAQIGAGVAGKVDVDLKGALVRRLQEEMLLTEDQAAEVIARYGVQQASEAADHVAKMFLAGTVRKIAPYYLTVVANFAPEHAQTSSLAAGPRRPVEGEADEESGAAKKISAFKQHWARLLQEALERLSSAEEEELLEAFQMHIENDPIASVAYRKHQLNNQMIQALYRIFAAERLLPDKHASFNEWTQKRDASE